MEVYHYHSVTGKYLGKARADESPLEPGVYLTDTKGTVIMKTKYMPSPKMGALK